jgi:hypothetical protein
VAVGRHPEHARDTLTLGQSFSWCISPEVEMADHDELYHPERDRDDPPAKPKAADFWKTHRVRQIKTPDWRTRQTGLPLLFSPPAMDSVWDIDFGGKPKREMSTFAFETRPGSKAQFIGVAVPKGIVPKAYLIVFRHTAKEKDFPDKDLLELGIGDYLIGRMQVSQQISASNKDVAAVVPIAMGGSGEFESSETFVRECLEQIDVALFDVRRPIPPLLVACNSDGIFKANNFLGSCPGLKKTIKAIYDFDGSFHVDAGGITLSVPGAHTFRYDGARALIPGPRADKSLFLVQVMNARPTRVPLPHDRWERHPFHTPASAKDKNWLHHHIPTCMLHHGLQRTRSI